MEFHEAANIFPMMTGQDYYDLRNDIKENGLLEPIILHDGKILDGRNRYTACLDLGIEPAFEEFKNGQSPISYVISKNLHRRHLNETQRGMIAGKIETMEHGGNRQDANLHLEITRKEAATMLNVSPRTIATVKAIEREAPELLPRLESGEMTAHEATKLIKKEKRQKEIEDINTGKAILPEGKFEVIVVDPPWPYGTKYDPDGRRAANPYPEMDIEEIKNIELPISDNCVLWLWTTHKFMRYSFEILDTWGFRDVAILTWVKDRMGLGTWLRSQSEFCIMAIRGEPIVNLTNQTTVINGAMREHSRKPDEFYAMVSELCPGRKLDYFSRETRETWETFGNETEHF
jgi:N6-adenosine-specific RNA methylase IME4